MRHETAQDPYVAQDNKIDYQKAPKWPWRQQSKDRQTTQVICVTSQTSQSLQI